MRTYTVLLFQDPTDPNTWLGTVPAVRGVHSSGDTRDHALAMTTLALEGVLEFLFDHVGTIPNDVSDLAAAQSATLDQFGLPEVEMEVTRLAVYFDVTATPAEPEVNSFAAASR